MLHESLDDDPQAFVPQRHTVPTVRSIRHLELVPEQRRLVSHGVELVIGIL